jgi:hypothetical protein
MSPQGDRFPQEIRRSPVWEQALSSKSGVSENHGGEDRFDAIIVHSAKK